MNRHASKGESRVARAFTLVELLVVITLLVVVVLIGLPAFASMLQGSARTLAENQIRAGMSSARDAAIRSMNGDSAAVFFFEPGGRTTIVPCIEVGTIKDRDPSGRAGTVERSVFAPISTSEPVQLPPGWMVRGYVPANRLHSATNATGWYPSYPGQREYDTTSGSWVFPETDFYDISAASDSRGGSVETLRQTFMVRFQARTGQLVMSETAPAVVVSPRPSTANRVPADGAVTRNNAETWKRVDRAAEGSAVWSRRTIQRLANDPTQQIVLRQLMGAESGDTILCGSVSLLSAYEENRLAASLGARGTNRVTGSMYQPHAGGTNPPRVDNTLFDSTYSSNNFVDRTDRWMIGRLTDLNGQFVSSDAILLSFDRFTAQPREIKP